MPLCWMIFFQKRRRILGIDACGAARHSASLGFRRQGQPDCRCKEANDIYLIDSESLFYPMTSPATTIEQYFDALPADRLPVMRRLHQAILAALPPGFEATMSYGMLGYVVPHSIYPAGYHCNPKEPLPFASLASQKNNISFYHMGLYAQPELLAWFQTAYADRVPGKLDMGKSCIRFKKPEQVPVELLAELCGKLAVADWIAIYEKEIKR